MNKEDKLTIVGGQASGGGQILFSSSIEKLLLKALSDENLKETFLQNRASVINNPEFALSSQDIAILQGIPQSRLKDMIEKFSSQRKTRRNFLKGAAATVALLATGIIPVSGEELKSLTPVPSKTFTPDHIFIPTTGIRPEHEIEVTNMEFQTKIKNTYFPKEGCHFCILNVIQQNISSEEQTYSGIFILFDTNGNKYEPLKELSPFWLKSIPPGGNNFGHMVFEIPIDAIPEKLVLFDNKNKPVITIQIPKYEK